MNVEQCVELFFSVLISILDEVRRESRRKFFLFFINMNNF